MNTIAYRRKNKGLTQEEMARLCGISKSLVAQIETNAKPLTKNTAEKLATVLGCTVIELLFPDAVVSEPIGAGALPLNSGLKDYRVRAGLSQVQLAKLVDTTGQQIGRLEKGGRKLTRQWADRLAPHLKCEAVDLVFEDHGIDYGLMEKSVKISIEEVRILPQELEASIMAKLIITVYQRAIDGGTDEQLQQTCEDIIKYQSLS